MSVDYFWDLTPSEIFLLIEGHQKRIDEQMKLAAWHAANIMNVHLKKKITIRKLLGKDRTMNEIERGIELSKLKEYLKKGEKNGQDNCQPTN
jgi:hypothetical protein